MSDNNATQQDRYWMKRALELAGRAGAMEEVPVGALIIKDGKLISTGFNRRETARTSLGHAELIAVQKASTKLGAWRLTGCTMYVTLEPCVMCAGALVQARVERLVYGAADPKGGGVRSLYQICENPKLNHRLQVEIGVLEKECATSLSNFFKTMRLKKKNPAL